MESLSTCAIKMKNEVRKEAGGSHVEPLRVMHVMDKLSLAGSGIHGVTRAVQRWVFHADPQKVQFCVCVLCAEESAAEIFEKKGVPVFFLGRTKFDVRILIDLFRMVKREQPDILHLHGYGATNFGRVVSVLIGIPNIVHEHVVIPNQPFYQTIADTFLSRVTTQAIACSESVREFMIQDRKVKPEKLEVVHYGLPLQELQTVDPEDVKRERARLGIPPEKKIVCNVGRLDTQKGLIYLLKAAVSILKEVPNTVFLLVGEGPERGNLESYVREAGIEKAVVFAGYREDVPVLLAMSDLVAMPSLWEGLPIALLESMNMRKPIVATFADGIKEVMRDGETGFLVPPRNVELLAERISRLLRDPELGRKMGQRAWEVCQSFDIARSVHRLDKIYHDLVS